MTKSSQSKRPEAPNRPIQNHIKKLGREKTLFAELDLTEIEWALRCSRETAKSRGLRYANCASACAPSLGDRNDR